MILWTAITAGLAFGSYKGNTHARIGLAAWLLFSLVMALHGGADIGRGD